MALRPTASIDRSQPSLKPFHEDEHADADQDHEADRGIGSSKIVALGKLVDKLPKAAEIDQEFDPYAIDEREDQPEPQSHEDGRQRSGKENLPELLRWGEIEAPAHVDEHAPGGAETLERLEHDRGKPRGEAHHHDGEGAPAEDHEIERIHQHQGGGSDRRDPGLGGERKQKVAVEQDHARNAEDGNKDAGGESFAGGEQEALEHVLLDDHAREGGDDVGGHRHDEAVDHAEANEEFHK